MLMTFTLLRWQASTRRSSATEVSNAPAKHVTPSLGGKFPLSAVKPMNTYESGLGTLRVRPSVTRTVTDTLSCRRTGMSLIPWSDIAGYVRNNPNQSRRKERAAASTRKNCTAFSI